jgi:hypothetical protein
MTSDKRFFFDILNSDFYVSSPSRNMQIPESAGMQAKSMLRRPEPFPGENDQFRHVHKQKPDVK